MQDADIDIIITNYRTPGLLKRLLESCKVFEPDCSVSYTVVDVDPLMTPVLDDSAFPELTYLSVPENIGYARACNLGAAITSGRNLALLNADTRFTNSHCVDRCVEFLDARPEVAVVGPLQVDSDGRVTHAGIFGTLEKPSERGFKAKSKKGLQGDQRAVYVNGSAFFTKRGVWDQMRHCHIFEEQFPEAKGAFPLTQHYYEETGYAYHVQAHGYQVWYLGSAEMVHEWHASSTVGSQSKHVAPSKAIFNQFCDAHGIPHG